MPSPATGDLRFIPNSQKRNKTRFMVNLSGTKKKPNVLQISSARGLPVSGAIAVQKAQSKSAREVGGPTTGRGGMQVWKKWPVADLSRKNLFNHLCDANLRTETWPGSTCRQKWQMAARGERFCQTRSQRPLIIASHYDGFCTVRSVSPFPWCVVRSSSSDLLFGEPK